MSLPNIQADGRSRRAGGTHSLLKKSKRRKERRKAKRDPEAQPTYGRYMGYEL